MDTMKDLLSSDIVQLPVHQSQPAPGTLALRREISAVISEALEQCGHSRIEIAHRMSLLTGSETSIHMLNAFAAPSRPQHTISLERAIAFDAATEGRHLLAYFARKRHAVLLAGEAAIHLKLDRIRSLKAQLQAEEKTIQTLLKRIA